MLNYLSSQMAEHEIGMYEGEKLFVDSKLPYNRKTAEYMDSMLEILLQAFLFTEVDEDFLELAKVIKNDLEEQSFLGRVITPKNNTSQWIN